MKKALSVLLCLCVLFSACVFADVSASAATSENLQIGKIKTIYGSTSDSNVAYRSWRLDSNAYGFVELLSSNKTYCTVIARDYAPLHTITLRAEVSYLTHYGYYTYFDEVYYLHIERPCLTIYFNANGGKVSVESANVMHSDCLGESLPTPTRNGYNFVGWFTQSVDGDQILSSTPITSSRTLYAHWALNDTTKPTGSISSTNNVSSSQTVTLTMGDSVGLSGYYWGTSSSTSPSFTSVSGTSKTVTVTVSASGTYYLTVKDISGNVYQVSKTFYKTTLDANGGSVSPTSVITASGNSFTLPIPTKTNYSYVGWSTSSSATSGMKTLTPTSNTTYYAVWDYVDTVKPIGSISSTNNVASNQTVTLTISDNVGLAGYYWGTNRDNPTFTSISGTNKTVNISVSSSGTYFLIVKDTSGNINQSSMTFYQTILNANEGAVSPSSIITASGNSFTLPTPTRSGYTFEGWYTDAGGGSQITASSTISGNTTLYAHWQQKKGKTVTYKITYKLNGGKNSSKNPKSYTKIDSTITLNKPTKKGYTFMGWYTNKKCTKKIEEIKKGSTGNKTLYAKWSKNTYKITYKLNGGKNSSKNPKKFSVTTKTITLKKPARKGYTFKGWYTDKKLTKKINKIKKGSTGSKTLYAKWGKTYKITYKLNGGKNNSKNPNTYTNVDATFTLKAPTRKNYYFVGWYTDKKLTKKITKIKKSSTGNKTIYAKWTKTPTKKEYFNKLRKYIRTNGTTTNDGRMYISTSEDSGGWYNVYSIYLESDNTISFKCGQYSQYGDIVTSITNLDGQSSTGLKSDIVKFSTFTSYPYAGTVLSGSGTIDIGTNKGAVRYTAKNYDRNYYSSSSNADHFIGSNLSNCVSSVGNYLKETTGISRYDLGIYYN